MMPSDAELDWSHALKTVRGNRAALATIVRTFLEEYPGRLTEMRGAVEQRTAKPLQLAAHSIKGPLRFFGADRAFRLARHLEELGRDERMEDAPAGLAELEAALASLEPRLREFITHE